MVQTWKDCPSYSAAFDNGMCSELNHRWRIEKKKCLKGHVSLMKIFKGPFWQSFATFIMPKIFKNWLPYMQNRQSLPFLVCLFAKYSGEPPKKEFFTHVNGYGLKYPIICGMNYMFRLPCTLALEILVTPCDSSPFLFCFISHFPSHFPLD